MKQIIFPFFFAFIGIHAFAQPKNFEGTIVYKVDVQSNSEGATADMWKKSFLLGDSLTVSIKDGNYKRSNGIIDEYYITKDEKVYMKFKGKDTLYFREYGDDSTKIFDISKTDETKEIAKIACKTIALKMARSTLKYYYGPSLYQNPQYDKNNTIYGYNIYAKETSAIWLELQTDYTALIIDTKAIEVREEKIDNQVFDLPILPVKKFTPATIFEPATYHGSSNNWIRYLQNNLNGNLATKFVKLPKGEQSATQVVYVRFVITENGELSNITIVNPKDIHPKLAKEAVRVITSSGKWTPAKMLGQSIVCLYTQPITYQVDRYLVKKQSRINS